jgi:hypothetical protein
MEQVDTKSIERVGPVSQYNKKYRWKKIVKGAAFRNKITVRSMVSPLKSTPPRG